MVEEIPTHCIGMRGTGWWRTLGFCVNQVRRNKVDVVHTHLTRAAYIGHALGLVTRKPIVTSVHIANHDKIYRRLAHGNNRIIAVSDYVRGVLHGLGVPMQFIETVYNGTDLLESDFTDPSITKAHFNIAQEREIIGVVARICKEKGALQMVRAMKSISAEHPNTQLMFVGRVVEEFRQELEDEIDAMGLRNRITFTGIRHDIPAIIDSFSVAAMPSDLETFGIAALESMARGKPVVATRVGGLPEVVRDGHTGLLVDLEESKIAAAINFLLSNREIRIAMGTEAKKTVAEQFTLQHMTSRFESVYNRCIDA